MMAVTQMRRYEETLQCIEAERDAALALLLEARDYIADETGGAYADDLEFAAKIDAALGPADD